MAKSFYPNNLAQKQPKEAIFQCADATAGVLRIRGKGIRMARTERLEGRGSIQLSYGPAIRQCPGGLPMGPFEFSLHMNAIIETGTATQVVRLEALLRASKAISTTGDHQHNIEIFMRELHSVMNFNYLFISDCVADAGEAKWMLEANGRRSEPAEVAFPLQECTGQWVHQEQQALLIA